LWFGNNTVIIIIGILASIAIPVFLSQREKAWNASAASELRNMAAAATSCSADNDGDYTTCDAANLENYGWSNDSDVTENVTLNNATDWAGDATHNSGNCTYTFTTEQANPNTGKVVPDPGDADC
jgi:type IV pilus assembly protein PilA